MICEFKNLCDLNENYELKKRKGVLFLCDYTNPKGVITDHMNSIIKYSKHNIFSINPRIFGKNPELFIKNLSFETIIIHYCINILYFLNEDWKKLISEFEGTKILIIQDEYRWIPQTNQCINRLGIDHIFSSLNPENAKKVYSFNLNNIKNIVSTLPGYVKDDFIRNYKFKIPISFRPIDVFYRGRKLPLTLGLRSQDKFKIGNLIKNNLSNKDFNLDISSEEKDRLYGFNWLISNYLSKTTLATQGGSSIFDFEGDLQEKYRLFLLDKNKTGIEFYKKYLKKLESNLIHATTTPRIFEAISTGTALILFEDEWNNILKPYRNYIPLKRNGENIKEISNLIRSDSYLEYIASNNFKDVLMNQKLNFRYYVKGLDILC